MNTKGDFILREVAGEKILVPTGEAAENFNGMITLNEVAAFIWKNIDSAANIEELVSRVLDEFEVDEETARRDTYTFMNAILAAGMIEKDPEE